MNFQIFEISVKQEVRLSKLVSEKFGIKLPIDKKIMFQSRLQPRLRELDLDSFEAYCDFIFKAENTISELTKMIDYISTNKTEFFREKEHFKLILNDLLPEMFRNTSNDQVRYIRCWSAGCSNGQEAFSLAMTLEDFFSKSKSYGDYQILGTDVSDRMLKTAQNGVYPFSQVKFIPEEYLKKYALKSKGSQNPRIKIMKSIQSKLEFRYSNLMDKKYSINQKFQIIFIRNTLIYFNQENQYQILKKVIDQLLPGGYLFIGHSESLINLDLPIRIISPSVYQKFSNDE